ncbi:hypothetical protein ACR6HW_13555 [Fusibacter sp. JL298sf-3]
MKKRVVSAMVLFVLMATNVSGVLAMMDNSNRGAEVLYDPPPVRSSTDLIE